MVVVWAWASELGEGWVKFLENGKKESKQRMSHYNQHLSIINTMVGALRVKYVYTEIRTDRQTTDGQADRQTGRQADRQTYIHTYIHTYRQTDRQTDRQTGRQTDRQTNRQTDRQTGRQTDRQTDGKRNTIDLRAATQIFIYFGV